MSATTVDTDEERFEETFPTTNVLAYVPGVLLLIVIGLLGKYAQIGWNALAKHQGLDGPRHRVCVVGDPDRTPHHQHRRRPSRVPAGRADLRVLAEDRNRLSGFTIRPR
jgi:hypothetical protein